MKIGDKVLIIGTVDEIRKDTVIIRNEGGYFGTVKSEIIKGDLIRCKECKHHKGYNCDRLYGMQDAFMARDDDYCSWAKRKDDD